MRRAPYHTGTLRKFAPRAAVESDFLAPLEKICAPFAPRPHPNPSHPRAPPRLGPKHFALHALHVHLGSIHVPSEPTERRALGLRLLRLAQRWPYFLSISMLPACARRVCTVFMYICARAFYQRCDASGAELFLKRLRSASPPHFSTTASKPRKDTTRLTSMKIQCSTLSVAGKGEGGGGGGGAGWRCYLALSRSRTSASTRASAPCRQ